VRVDTALALEIYRKVTRGPERLEWHPHGLAPTNLEETRGQGAKIQKGKNRCFAKVKTRMQGAALRTDNMTYIMPRGQAQGDVGYPGGIAKLLRGTGDTARTVGDILADDTPVRAGRVKTVAGQVEGGAVERTQGSNTRAGTAYAKTDNKAQEERQGGHSKGTTAGEVQRHPRGRG
jgi:hypothetical protein